MALSQSKGIEHPVRHGASQDRQLSVDVRAPSAYRNSI